MSSHGKESVCLLGWDSFFEDQLKSLNEPSWVPARVVGEEKNLFRLQVRGGSLFWGEISGRYHFLSVERAELPTIGDWVACAISPNAERAIIHRCLERRTCLVRKVAGRRHDTQVLASNVDVAFITMSLNADLNLRRIERYLTLVWDSGAVPVILLTKADLAPNVEELIQEVEKGAVGVDICAISTVTGEGMERLLSYLQPSKTVVFLGSSGVGKSTLVNHLLGENLLETQGVREKDDKGRHTTTGRYLFQTQNGALLIDTPGMRELHLSDQEEGLGTLFADIESLALMCKFSNCEHRTEPGCRIKAALENGELALERMESYKKLQKEIAFERSKTDKAFASSIKSQWKKIGKDYRARVKLKGRGE